MRVIYLPERICPLFCLQKKVFSNQNKDHLGSSYIGYIGLSRQIVATSAKVTPKGSLVGESSQTWTYMIYLLRNYIVIRPDILLEMFCFFVVNRKRGEFFHGGHYFRIEFSDSLSAE